MIRMRTIRLILLLLCTSLGAAAQSDPQSPPASQPASPPETTTPAPGFGQNTPMLNPENPPVTGLDEPGLDLHTASRSFIAPALQLSESADTNGGNQLAGNELESVTHVLGALDLQQFWTKSDFFLEYLGGGAFYSTPFVARQLQAVGLEGVTRWRTGQLTVRDSFSYLPDGSFQIDYGGSPGLGLTNTGIGAVAQSGGLPGTQLFGGSQFGSLENIPRLTNTAILDAIQAINPISAITVAGGYSNSHFFDSTNSLINSDAVTIEGGYSRLISRTDQIGVLYAFQLLQFPQENGGQIYLHVFNLRWSHTITGRLSLVAGAGPQYTELEAGGSSTRWSLSALVQLRYKLRHASLVASYQKFTSPGSGFYAGADTQTARLAYSRPLGRTWVFYGDLGYSHNARLQNAIPGIGAQAGSYDEGFATAAFRKHLGRSYDFFAFYRFGELGFSSPVDVLGSTGTTSQRQTGTIGVEWHPRPTRID